MNKILLVTRPRHDLPTNYLYFWSQKVIDEARKKGFTVLDLSEKKANRKTFLSYVKKNNPSLVFFNGHGSEKIITGHNNGTIVSEKEDKRIVKEKIIYARSCDAVNFLGQEWIKKGAITFVGYERKFFLGYSYNKITRPLDDEVARLFLEPSNSVIESLLKGNSVRKAVKKSKQYMRKNLLFMLSSASSEDQRDAAPFLYNNILSQKALGSLTAKV